MRYRVNVLREIHGRTNDLYCRTGSRLLETYLRVAAAAEPERGRQAQVLGFFLDYTGRALFRGRHLSTKRRRQHMEETGEQMLTELDAALNRPMPEASASEPRPADFTPVNATAAEPSASREVISVSDSDETTARRAPSRRPPLPHFPRAQAGSAPVQSPEQDATDAEQNMLTAVRRAAFIVAQGGPHHISRAASSLSSAPLAPLNNVTVAKLQELHPPATELMADLPDRAVGIADIDPARLDRVLRRRVHNGSAPGLSGMTGSHLVALWTKATPNGRLGFQLLIRDICNGVFDGDLKQRLLTCVLVALTKKNGGVRPVAVAEVLVRCAAFYMMDLIAGDMPSFFPKIQFGVKMPGGSEAAAQLTRAELAYAATKRANVIALKIDFKNAFNAITRARVWAALLAHPKATPILKAFFWQYSDASPLLLFERGEFFRQLLSRNGVRQGCPFAAFAFALAVQPLYEAALRCAPDCNGFSIQDDFTIVGPAEQVMRAYEYLKQHAQTDLGLELVTEKCQVFLPQTLPVESVALVQKMCTDRGLPCSAQMESLGVMFGPAASVTAHCDAAVANSEHFFACVSHPAMPVQTAALLLRYCGVPKLGYLARTTHPDLLLNPARRFDEMALQTQLTILQQSEESLTELEPRTSDPDSTVHDPGDGDPPLGSQPRAITQRASAVSKQQLLQRIALPLSLGGLGLRSVEQTRHAAYFASLQQILPYFAQLHPELCDAARGFEQTQLYRELVECQTVLVSAGAATAVEIALDQHDALQTELPFHSAAETAVLAAVSSSAEAPAAPGAPPSITAAAAKSAPRQAAFLSTRFPSPSPALTQSIDETWQRAVRSVRSSDNSFSAVKLQRDITGCLEASAWVQLFNSCGRYQQAILTSLSLNPSTSAWLSMPPLSSEPGYRMRDEEYRLAIRHRLGQLPFDDLRSEYCVGCANCNNEMPSLLVDPDHAHSCCLQKGVSLKRRHDDLKQVLAELARSCGYSVEVEPLFPAVRDIISYDPSTGQQAKVERPVLEHGDLLLVRGSTRELIDVTVARPNCLTLLRGSAANGAHMRPLVAAAQAEERKHTTYDAECARHGWKMVPFAMESLGAKGVEATQLLLRMASHSLDKSPAAFMEHADRRLSACLQIGNAHVAVQGTTDILLHSYRSSLSLPSGMDAGTTGLRASGSRGTRQQPRSASALRSEAAIPCNFTSIVHADYRSARVGVRGRGVASTAAAC